MVLVWKLLEKVSEVGSNVSEFNKGDNIAYASVPLGAYAQQRIIPSKIAKIPDGISHELAATLMTKGLTTNCYLQKLIGLKLVRRFFSCSG